MHVSISRTTLYIRKYYCASRVDAKPNDGCHKLRLGITINIAIKHPNISQRSCNAKQVQYLNLGTNRQKNKPILLSPIHARRHSEEGVDSCTGPLGLCRVCLSERWWCGCAAPWWRWGPRGCRWAHSAARRARLTTGPTHTVATATTPVLCWSLRIGQ